jgi:hypothetical protein
MLTQPAGAASVPRAMSHGCDNRARDVGAAGVLSRAWRRFRRLSRNWYGGPEAALPAATRQSAAMAASRCSRSQSVM